MQYVVHSLGQLLFKVSVVYLRAGYVYYTLGEIPKHKEPEAIDRKLLTHYQVTRCRMTRLRQRKQGNATVMYLRLHHRFILMATEGRHEFFEHERPYDCRKRPILLSGYSIGMRGTKPWVMIAPQRWTVICREAHKMALHNHAKVTAYLENITPLTFQGIIEQRLKLVQSINQRRRSARLSTIELHNI